jgi:hypothetical protein
VSNELGKALDEAAKTAKRAHQVMKPLSAGIDDVKRAVGLQRGGKLSGGRVQRGRPQSRVVSRRR